MNSSVQDAYLYRTSRWAYNSAIISTLIKKVKHKAKNKQKIQMQI